MEKEIERIIVIGAGQAGQAVCTELRDQKYEGEIILIGSEAELPYQRPPLSKGYLLNEVSKERLLLRPQAYYEGANITLRLDTSVNSIDRENRQVHLADETLGYDRLVLTTGSSPRRLPAAVGGDLGGVFTVRSIADVDAMAAYFKPGKRCAIIGGGYIGLEAAAVARKCGLNVVLVEMSERILQRVASTQTSDFFRLLHRSEEVKVWESTGLERLVGDGHVQKAIFNNGEDLDVDFVIVGIGIMPNTALAENAGLVIENGIAVDAQSRTSDPNIYAAGDCASFPHRGGRLRLESVPNAIDQAQNAARNILGQNVDYAPSIWFWSDQYDKKLQIAGLNQGFDQVVTRQASEDSVSFWYFKEGALVSVDAINDPRAYMVAKRMIDQGLTISPQEAADTGLELKTLLRRA